MNENTKTALFVAAAVVLLGAAVVARPRPVSVDESAQTTGKFFPDFKDPLTASSLEVIGYDDTTGEVKPFKVAKVNGRWSIPSKMDYPADAERQLGEAAASVIDLEKMDVASKDPGDHELYGVVDPSTAKPGTSGVGTRVTFEDANSKKLAQFIIGKQDKGSSDVRFVRVPGQDIVYRVKVNIDKLSTKFSDWIEKDLLKLNALDLRRIILNNYSIDEVQGRRVPGELIELNYNEKDAKWTLANLEPGKELDTQKINDLKNALDDLKIVDVRRKPAGLSRELRTEEGIRIDTQALMSLQSKGFYIADNQLLSNEGEVICQTKDGIEYMLRFGEVASGTEEADETKQDSEADEKTDAEQTDAETPAEGETNSEEGETPPTSPSGAANRYIFVTARFVPELLPQPDLQPLPGEEPKAEAEEAETEQPAEGEQPAEEAKAGQEGDEKAAEPTKEVSEADRKRIEAENKRKQDEFDEKVKQGKKRVEELNHRFADWYYVISDDVYRKVHLSLAELVKKETKPAGEGDSVDDFNTLQEDLRPGTPSETEEQSPAETPATETPEAAVPEATQPETVQPEETQPESTQPEATP